MAQPVVEGWFTTTAEPALVGQRCEGCGSVAFPPVRSRCPDPACGQEPLEPVELSRFGAVWSYTDAQYQPPPPYVAPEAGHRPFALAAVELPEGLVVLGQVSDGFGVADLRVGGQVELVVETLYVDEEVERTVWRWRPVATAGTGR